MATLSFVALSLQTTHLDPSTVSKADYVKLVDGNMTRLDSIAIDQPSPADADEPTDTTGITKTTSWEAALSQLSMVVGKLPVVSYYRDADKEIFQAASRHIDTAPPDFHWLDCRALIRQLVPDLPEYQLSTVLKALDLYDDYADRSTVEQTVQIVLTLARRQQTTSLRELWGDLYHQPDDLLDLEASLETGPISIDPTAPADLPPAVPPMMPDIFGAAVEDPPGHEAPVQYEDLVSAADIPPEDPGAEAVTLQEDAAHDAASVEEVVRPDEGPDQLAEAPDDTPEHVLEAYAQDEQPEFLKIPPSSTSEADEPVEALEATAPIAPAEDDTAGEPVAPDEDDEDTDDETSQDTPSLPRPIDSTEPSAATSNLDEVDQVEVAESLQGPETPTPQAAETSEASPVADDSTPAPSAGPEPEPSNTTAPVAYDQPVVDEALSSPTITPAAGSRGMVSFVWAIVFGVLSLAGAVVTIMAVLLFFSSTSELLLETKIGGVILTGGITGLCVLLTVTNFHRFRRKRRRAAQRK